MKVSAYIICKNESSVIARCINSLKDAVDEIIVVDSGSTDSTIDIAKSLGTIVYSIQWRDDFSYARNYALERCSGDWVIPLDADEYFREGDVQKIRAYLKSLEENVSGYDGLLCKLVNIDPATSQSISRMTHLLVFQKSPDMRYRRPIHEQLLKGDRPLHLMYVEDIVVLHTGYVLTGEKIKDKTLRNVSILEKAVANGTADASDYFHLTQLYLGDSRSADEIYAVAKKMVDLDKNGRGVPDTVAHRKYTLWATALQRKGHSIEEIMRVLDAAYEKFPKHPEVLAARGDAYLYAKKPDCAINEYEKALLAEKGFDGIATNSFTKRVPEIRLKLCELSLLCNNRVKALEHCYELLRHDKYTVDATLMLLHLIRAEDPQDAIAFLDALYHRDNKEDVHYLIRCLSIIRTPALLGFYEKIWSADYDMRDESLIYALLCLGNYQTAFKTALDYLALCRDDEVHALACAAIVLGSLSDECKAALQNIGTQDDATLEAAERLKSGQPIDSMEYEQECLIRVLRHIVQSIPEGDAYPYLEGIALTGSAQIKQAVINDLLRARRYPVLSDFYDVLAQTDHKMRGQNLFFSGYYSMLCGEYRQASEQFSKAKNCGYDRVEMHEYTRIIVNAAV